MELRLTSNVPEPPFKKRDGHILNQIYNIDCRAGCKLLPDNYAHSIVTDPPYFLTSCNKIPLERIKGTTRQKIKGFMEKSWDGYEIETEWKDTVPEEIEQIPCRYSEEVLWIKAAGAYVVPLNITQIKEAAATGREIPKPVYPDKIDAYYEFTRSWAKEAFRILRPGGYLLAFGGTKTYHIMASAIENAGFEIKDKIDYFHNVNDLLFKFINSLSEAQLDAFIRLLEQQGLPGFISWVYGQGFPKGLNVYRALLKRGEPELAERWRGWEKTALKPANEPICVAQKPIERDTLLDNILKWETGAFNTGSNRIPVSGMSKGDGRMPTNVVLDETAAALLDNQSGILKSGTNCVRRKTGFFFEHGSLGKPGDVQVTYGDSGGASRFFYCAKASQKEKGEGNIHPTVKPLSLIKHLVSLVTPAGGISVDLFSGSGTHALACMELGINYIGFEKDRQYYELSLKRLKDIERR